MNKVFLKIVPEAFETESRDMRELQAVKKLNYDIHILARQNEKKSLPYKEKNELYSLERLDIQIKEGSGLVSKAFSKLKRALLWRKTIVSKGMTIKPDIISAHDLFALWGGARLKKKIEKKTKRRCMLVYDAHELTTERAGLRQAPKLYQWLVERNEKIYIKKADVVMVVCDSIAEHNQKKYKLKKKPTVVRNIPLKKEFAGEYNHFREKLGIEDDKVILLYQGFFKAGRGIKNVIQALKLLEEKYVFVMLGYTESMYDDHYEYAKRLGVEKRLFYLPSVSQEVLHEYSNSADIGVCLIENCSLSYYYSLPNKLFEYINADLPYICSNFPEMSKITNHYAIGEVVEYDNIEEIAKAISTMEKDKREQYLKNLKIAKRELTWEKEERVLLDMYTKIEGEIKNV